MQNHIEKTLDSREVAEMVEKEHKNLVRDIRRYITQFGQSKIEPSEFFTESTYKTDRGKEYSCYRITKKGCEFIAHKLTGTKGTAFTARYINRFHEMENIITNQAAVQTQDNSGLAKLQAAVQAQGKILDNISRKLAGGTVIGIGSRNEQDMYKVEIVRLVQSMQDREALCKVYTFAKYVPQQ